MKAARRRTQSVEWGDGRNSLILLILCSALVFIGCGNGGESPADVGRDTSETDVGTRDIDSGETPGDFQVGTHPPHETTAEQFTLLTDGTEVPFYFGVQGSWMVVLAFRTRDMFEGTFDVVGEISIDGTDAGDLWLADQETFPGGDGWHYYYNFFLAIEHEAPSRGTPVDILLRVTDESGTTAERQYALEAGPANGPSR